MPTAAGEPSAYKLVPDAERHLLLTAETHNFPTGVAPFEGAATVRSLIPLACALNIVPPKSTFTEPFSSPLCTFPHTGHWRPHSRCAGHRPWCSCGRGHRRLLRRQPPHSRLRHALGGCGASLAHCRTRRTRTGTARGGARSFPLPFFSELGLPQQLCSPPANRSEPAHKRLFAPVPRRASSCSNPTFFSPAQIDASNGASDYGNKFGEPVIVGFNRSFGMRLPNGERREWLKPIMFSAGLGLMPACQAKKGEPEEGMWVVKIGGPPTASCKTMYKNRISYA